MNRFINLAILIETGPQKLPSWIGGVDAASADGVVDNSATTGGFHFIQLVLPPRHPAQKNEPDATPPIQEGSFEYR
jgi:hypothetical protein